MLTRAVELPHHILAVGGHELAVFCDVILQDFSYGRVSVLIECNVFGVEFEIKVFSEEFADRSDSLRANSNIEYQV